MSRRRTQRSTEDEQKRRRRGKQLFQGTLIESLESRRLLTTVITDTDPLTPAPSRFSFEYKDARDNAVRVVVVGDVSAEFIFARMTKGDDKGGGGWNELILNEHVPAGSKEDGRDLFHVYVAQASIDSYISIAHVPPVTTQGPRPMQPFTGGVSLTVFPSRGNELSKTTPGGTGDIFLGARTWTVPNVDNSGNRPIVYDNFNGLGIAPAPGSGRLFAGVSTAPNVSLGRFMFAGAISGHVFIQGSMQHFYCGALLTGMTAGQSEGAPLDPGNFYVAGDIRDILVKGSIGTHDVPGGNDRDKPNYFTGADFDIKGKVGQIRAGVDYMGSGTIYNNTPGNGLRTRQQEIEFRINPAINRGQFTDFENGQFGDNDAFFSNDTFDTAQFLGAINSKQLGAGSIQLNGYLQSVTLINDFVDYYAVPLMAGQTINIRMMAPITFQQQVIRNGVPTLVTVEQKSPLYVALIDPLQRLVASDHSSKGALTTQDPDDAFDPRQQELFSFKADRPGIYRIAVHTDAPTFAGAIRAGLVRYQLQVTGVGNVGLGGLVGNTIVATPSVGFIIDPGGGNIGGPGTNARSITGEYSNIEVVHGDLGAVFSTDYIVSTGGITATSVGGNLRAVDGLSLGIQDANVYRESIQVLAVTGSVGMVRGRESSGTAATDFNTFFNTPNLNFPIGRDVQWVIAADELITDLVVNGSVGVVQANSMGISTYAGSLNVNFDGVGKPGVIDLVECTTDLGTFQAGGPDINTNFGGNVRYIHVGGTAYRPRGFGGGSPEETTYVAGQEAQLTEDSGAQIILRPTLDQVFNPLTGGILDNSGVLTVLTYPIGRSLTEQGAAGVVIVRVTSTRGLAVRVTGGSAEIGEIVSQGSGPALVVDPGFDGIPNTADDNLGVDGIRNTGDDPFVLDPNAFSITGQPLDNSIDIRGGLVDVFDINGGGNFNYIRNFTPGEIVSTDVGPTLLLEATNLGFARSVVTPGTAVEGNVISDLVNTTDTEGSVFPYLQTKAAIIVHATSETGFAIQQLRAREAIGNVMILGRVQRIIANADGAGVKGVYEGITGSIFVRGQLREINIGEGVMPSGSGEFSHAGIYVLAEGGNFINDNSGLGRIGTVVNQGMGSDIRGDIVANNGIDQIILDGGSIINADIGVISGSAIVQGDPEQPVGGANFITTREFTTNYRIRQDGNIKLISIKNGGGIIGSWLRIYNIDDVVIKDGFGMVNTVLSTVGAGRFGNFTADGFGFRGVFWRGGQSLGNITATGLGNRLKTTAYPASLRFSEYLPMDPFFGVRPDALTDLHIVLGTSALMPSRKGTSASGTLDLSEVAVSRDVGSINVSSIRASNFNVGNNINSIVNRSYIDSARVTAGRIGTVAIGKDSLRTSFQVAGPVGPVIVGGTFRGSSRFFSSGQNGTIESFTVGKHLYGNVYAQKRIGVISVGGSYGSQGTRSGGSMGQFIVNGSFVSDSTLEVDDRLDQLTIGGDLEDGTLIRLGTLGNKIIGGAEVGTIDLKPWA
ncbi:MAG: hypothetical protein QOE14_2915 [Humisphaera sp.]|nr:hypothetical protein [Humisphaera sp.]